MKGNPKSVEMIKARMKNVVNGVRKAVAVVVTTSIASSRYTCMSQVELEELRNNWKSIEGNGRSCWRGRRPHCVR